MQAIGAIRPTRKISDLLESLNPELQRKNRGELNGNDYLRDLEAQMRFYVSLEP